MARITITADRAQAGHVGRLSALTTTVALVFACVAPAAATAAITTFDSSLPVPATLNTSEDLKYKGTYTPVGSESVYTSHYGADTALWNTTVAAGQATAPADGQVLKVSLEGCAKPAPSGPVPLTEIHFQALVPLAGGGAKVALTSQSFQIPVCGQGGASGSTISTYEPINLCVSAGDYVAFNDDGGFVEGAYRSGVPYEVMGSVLGSTMDSFIKHEGTGNGATFSPSESSNMDGFAVNEGVELMLQATLGSGPDATPLCPGGTAGQAPASSPSATKHLPPVKLVPQTDRVNRQHLVAVRMYCRLITGCDGTAVLTSTNGRIRYGSVHFAIPGAQTSHVPIRLDHAALVRLRKHHRRLTTTLAVMVDEQLVHQIVRLRG
jgi:hypothetical protein